MDAQVNIREITTHLSELIQRVMDGETIIITKSGKPVAILTSYEATMEARVPGNDVGRVVIADDFDSPLGSELL